MSRCKECDREIVWAETQHGKKIPLDPAAPVFRVIRDRDRIYGQMVTWAEKLSSAMVSHFSTCPADLSAVKKNSTKQFSRGQHVVD